MTMMMKDMPALEKPREKAKLYGFNALSNAELLAIIIRTGTKQKSVKELALEILKEMESVKGLKNSKISKLANIKGVGEVKAITILAAIELGKRLSQNEKKNKLKIRESSDVYNAYRFMLENEIQEKFMAIFLNNQNEVLASKILFIGTSKESLIEPKEIFKEAMLYNASKLIVLHNHPSGNPAPSKEDFSVTDQLKKVGNLLNIYLIDHLIIGHDTYFSFYSYIRREENNEKR